eukprot:48970_1
MSSQFCNTLAFNIITFLLLLVLLITSTQSQFNFNPTPQPSTPQPSITPTTEPTTDPTPAPTPNPTQQPTPEPTSKPSSTTDPTEVPTTIPTINPAQTLSPTEFPTIQPTLSPTDDPTELLTNIPTTNPTEIGFTINPTQIPTSMPNGGQCFIGEECTKTYECCIGNVSTKKRGILCECKHGKEDMCDVKYCCIKIGYKGCFYDNDCCKPDAICNNGICMKDKDNKYGIESMNLKSDNQMSNYNSLLNNQGGDNKVLKTLDSARSGGYLEWIIIGVCLYFITMFIIFRIHKCIQDKKSYEDEIDENGGSQRDTENDIIEQQL